MHKIVSLSLDERIVDLLDDETLEPDCHNRSQLIRKIIRNHVKEMKQKKEQNQLRQLEKKWGL